MTAIEHIMEIVTPSVRKAYDEGYDLAVEQAMETIQTAKKLPMNDRMKLAFIESTLLHMKQIGKPQTNPS